MARKRKSLGSAEGCVSHHPYPASPYPASLCWLPSLAVFAVGCASLIRRVTRVCACATCTGSSRISSSASSMIYWLRPPAPGQPAPEQGLPARDRPARARSRRLRMNTHDVLLRHAWGKHTLTLKCTPSPSNVNQKVYSGICWARLRRTLR